MGFYSSSGNNLQSVSYWFIKCKHCRWQWYIRNVCGDNFAILTFPFSGILIQFVEIAFCRLSTAEWMKWMRSVYSFFQVLVVILSVFTQNSRSKTFEKPILNRLCINCKLHKDKTDQLPVGLCPAQKCFFILMHTSCFFFCCLVDC